MATVAAFVGVSDRGRCSVRGGLQEALGSDTHFSRKLGKPSAKALRIRDFPL